jgi:heme A synthase
VSELTISLIAFACIFTGTMLGMIVRNILPEHHLSDESKDAVMMGAGMIATMAALVLGLLIASAKGSFDTMNSEIRKVGSRVILLDSSR